MTKRGWLDGMIEILRRGPMRTPTLREIEECDAVFILGEDVTNVAPRMALAVRQSVRQQPMEIAKGLKIPLWLDHGVRDALQDAQRPALYRDAICHAPGRGGNRHVPRRA